MIGLPYAKESILSLFDTVPKCDGRIEGRTDGRTDIIAI